MLPRISIGRTRVLRYAIFALFFSTALHGAVWHVRPPGSVAGAADGTSWTTALPGLEAAAALAQAGDEIRMAGGIYTNHTVLPAGVTMVGGFAGTEAVGMGPAEPFEKTVLHGGDAGTVLIVLPGADVPTKLRNLTLTHGNGNEGPTPGGGIAATNAWLVLENCRLQSNRSAEPLASALDLQGGRLEARDVVIAYNGDTSFTFIQSQGPIRVAEAIVKIERSCWLSNNGRLAGIGTLENCQGFLLDSRIMFNQATGGEDTAVAALVIRGGELRLQRNRFIRNSAYGPTVVRFVNGATVDVANNLFSESSTGYPLTASGSSALLIETNTAVRVRHNTFVNTFAVVSVAALAPTTVVANNLFDGGEYGVFGPEGVTVANNGFWHVRTNNVTGGVIDVGSLVADPGFAGQPRRGEAHLISGSSLRDAGAAEYAVDLTTDLLGQPRVHGPAPDIGAFEIHDPVVFPVSSVIHLSPEGDDRQSGRSWATAKRDAQEALDVASLDLSEVWIRNGHYAGRFTVAAGVDLYGGFEGAEVSRDQRDWRKNRPVLDGEGLGRVLTLNGSISNVVDGLVVRNGTSRWNGAGLYGYGDTQIRRSRFEHNEVIVTNRIFGSSTVYGGGAVGLSYPNQASIEGNEFVANQVALTGMVNGNTMGGGAVWVEGSGISSLRVANNLFSGNRVVLQSASLVGAPGPAMLSQGASVQLGNNTFTGNELVFKSTFAFPSAHPSVAISGGDSSHPLEVSAVNNLFAYNDGGLALNTSSVHGLIKSNLFFGNKYSSLDEPWRSNNVFADPKFSGSAPGWRLRPDSPARDAGDDAAVLGAEDILGGPRIQNGRVDIGAAENDGTDPVEPSTRLFVKPDGDDLHDGLSWSTAMRTLTNTVDRARGDFAEIWVQAGVYREKLDLPGGVQLLGGFAGHETNVVERNWVQNETVLDGKDLAVGPLIRLPAHAVLSRVSGFTLRNSTATQGGAIYCASDAIIERNRFTGNKATILGGGSTSESYQGAALYLAANSRALVMNNLFVSNGVSGDSTKGVVYCASDARPLILHNTLVGNRVSTGSILFYTNTAALAAFNLLAYGNEAIQTSTPFDILRYNGFSSGFVTDQHRTNLSVLGDPFLVQRNAGNYHLRADSPLRDVASFEGFTNAVVQLTGSTELLPRLAEGYAEGLDYYGNPRTLDSRLDIGAAEALSGPVSGVELTVTQPVTGTVTNAGARLPAAVTVVPSEVELVSVDYFYGGVPVFSTNNPPFAGLWTSDSVGELPFVAHGVLPNGLIVTSAPVTVTRLVPPNNRPPQVSVSLPQSPLRAYRRPRFTFSVFDPEDRTLSLVALKFDGELLFATNSVFSGFSLNLSLPQLTPGMHQLDATARDNYGVATNRSYTLTVLEPQYLPLASPTNPAAGLRALVFEALNDSGEAAGAGRTELINPLPIGWQNGLLSRFGTNAGTIHSLNSSGVGAGEIRLEDGSTLPARFEGGVVEILSTNTGLATVINENGTILGHFSPPNADQSFLWRNQELQTMTNDPATVFAVLGVTDDERVLVQLKADGEPTVPAWRLDDGTLHPLLEFTDTRFVALGLNGDGLVTGYVSPVSSPSELRAALWQGGELHLLGNTPNQTTWGRAVNRDGLVLGVLDLPSPGIVPALFDRTNTIRLDLLLAGDVGEGGIPSLLALNSSGWLAGQVNNEALLLTPVDQAVAPECHLREASPGTWEVEVRSLYAPVTLTLESSADLSAWQAISVQRAGGFIFTLPAAEAQARFFRASLRP